MAQARLSKTKNVQKQSPVTPLSGRNDPYNPDLKGLAEFLRAQTELWQAFLVHKAGQNPPLFSRNALAQTKTTTPPATHSQKDAHQCSGLGVPDLHVVVERPADDTIAVRGESDGQHAAKVPRQRVHLPPAHHYPRPLPRRNLRGTLNNLNDHCGHLPPAHHYLKTTSKAKPAANDCWTHSHHFPTLNAIPQNCPPRLRSRCSRSSRAYPMIR